MFTPKNQKQNISSSNAAAIESGVVERLALLASLFFFAFGIGLIVDGKKIYSHQLRVSERVDYQATLNPYR